MASPNAKTREETLAEGKDTFGVSLGRHAEGGVRLELTMICWDLQALNQHPLPEVQETAFRVGVSVDRNKKCRRTMEE